VVRFNAGSALEANGMAALAFMNTFLATACAVLSWIFAEWMVKGKPSMLAPPPVPSPAWSRSRRRPVTWHPGRLRDRTCGRPICLWGVTV